MSGIDWLLTLMAVLTCGVGALWVYLTSPQQQWRSDGPLPITHLWPAAVGLFASLCLFLRLLGAVEAVFTWLMLLMFAWSGLPFLCAWRAQCRQRAQ